MLLAVWVLSAAYMGSYLKRGWVAHDEGALAQSAERVLQGELPHRDFDELYTGGLSYLNAFAFLALGKELDSPRIVLFAFFLAWVPVVYFLASHFASPVSAGSVTLLVVAWSVPNYAAAVPSWYNLFFAVFGTGALFRHLEIGSSRWLLLAGVCGGLSFLAKIGGLYYIAAVLLFLTFREQCLTGANPGETPEGGRGYRLWVQGALLLFVAALFGLIYSRFGSAELIHFVLPGAFLAALLLGRELQRGRTRDRKRSEILFQLLLPFGVGAALPVAIFLIPYALSSSLPALANGMFVLPFIRLSMASWSPSGFSEALWPLLVLGALLGVALYSRSPIPWFLTAVQALQLTLVLAAARKQPAMYQFVWHSLDLLLPVTVLAGVVLLWEPRASRALSLHRQQQVMLLLAMVAMGNLVQFPFARPIYFCYVAPLAALALLAVLSSRPQPQRFLLSSLLCFYLLFAVLLVTPGFIYEMGSGYSANTQTDRLTLPRAGGLRVDPGEAEEYQRLIPLVQEHAAGEFIYAAPDCPEVYFLSGLRNPTRILFDFFDDPAGRTERILSALERHQVKVVVILTEPSFSEPLTPDLRADLRKRFPHSTTVGRFQVRWRP